jgi:invasion protein IalB
MKRLHTCIIILLLTLIVTAMSHAETVVKPFQQDIPDLLKPAFSGELGKAISAWQVFCTKATSETNIRLPWW